MNLKGGSYTELLLVIALLSIIGLLSLPFYTGFVLRSNMQTTRDKVVSSIRKAQMYSISARAGGAWGLCLYESKVRIYRGTCESPTRKEDYDIPSSVNVSGLSDTQFSVLRGEPTNTLSITISSSIDSININLNQSGGMDIQ